MERRTLTAPRDPATLNRQLFFERLGFNPNLVRADNVGPGGFDYYGLHVPPGWQILRIDSGSGAARIGWQSPGQYQDWLTVERSDLDWIRGQQLRAAEPRATIETSPAKPTRGLRHLITHWLRN